MKMLYLSRLDIHNTKHIGTYNKVATMCNGFERNGQLVYLERYNGPKTEIVRVADGTVCFEKEYGTGVKGRYQFYRDIVSWALQQQVNYFYIRFDHLDFFASSAYKRAQKAGITVILELPTYPYEGERDKRHRELLIRKKYVQYLIKKLLVLDEQIHIRGVHRYIHRIVTYTHTGNIWNTPTLCIDNGIDCNRIQLREHSCIKGQMRFVCIANLSIWHALDRFVEGLKNYVGSKQNLEIKPVLWVVGEGSELPHIKELVSQYGLEDYVKFLGPQHGEALDRIISQADIGIGTLGLHRIGLQWGSTLKAKEYCAYGLPFIYGSPEKSLTGSEPYALKLPSDDTPVDLEKVMDFAVKVCNNQDVFMQMRRKAEAEYSWDILTKNILEEGC